MGGFCLVELCLIWWDSGVSTAACECGDEGEPCVPSRRWWTRLAQGFQVGSCAPTTVGGRWCVVSGRNCGSDGAGGMLRGSSLCLGLGGGIVAPRQWSWPCYNQDQEDSDPEPWHICTMLISNHMTRLWRSTYCDDLLISNLKNGVWMCGRRVCLDADQLPLCPSVLLILYQQPSSTFNEIQWSCQQSNISIGFWNFS